VFSSIQQTAAVTTSPVQVFSVTGLSSATDVVLSNAGPQEIYVSGSSSAGTSGFPVPAYGQLLVSGAAANLWAVTASGTAAVNGSLGSVVANTTLLDTLMVTVPVTSTASQVFDLFQYQGVAQTEAPLATLGPAGSPAILSWPPAGPILAGGAQVNPAGQVGDAVLVNTGSQTVYLGATSAVTTSTGLPVTAGHKALLVAAAPGALYAVCAGGQASSMRTGLVTVSALA
jgi:hypothetical protein